MNRFIYFLFLFLFSFFLKSQDSSRFYDTIDTLCSPFFYGRAYKHDGHLKTANYLKARFEKADTTYYQEFDFGLNKIDDELLVLENDTLNACTDFITVPQSSGTIRTHFNTIYLDSLFFRSDRKIKKFLKKDINALAVVYNSKQESLITDNAILRKKIYAESGCILKLVDGNLLSSFSQKAWMPPSFFVKSKCWQNQKDITVRLNQKEAEIKSNNVVGVIKGNNKELKELIVSAHYDHVGGYETCFVPGANDNASGVAMMLELYHYFLENRPERTIRFIAFSGEEVGLIGSKFYVQNMDKNEVEFVLNLDLLGAGSKGVTVVNGKVFSSYMEKLQEVNEKKSYVKSIKLRGEAANSDHYYFSKNGVPAFFIYSNGSVGGYHNVTDTLEELEYGHFNALFFLLRDFVASI